MPTLLIYGVVALGILGVLGGIAYKLDHNGFERGTAEVTVKWDAANAAARAAEAAASAKAAADLEKARTERKTVIQKRTVYVDKIVDRPVYLNVCLDDDGLRCVNAAIRGESLAGCKPDDTVPGPRATDGKGR